MNCPRCGAALGPGSLFCAACGASVTDPGAATVSIATAAEGDELLVRLRAELAKDYQVEKELGRGGMAVVYRAREIELNRLVALKVLPPGMGSAAMAERFRREARLAAALDHPNIIPIYRVGQAAGTYYFAMKFVEGRAVDAILEQQGALPVPVILQVLLATAGALAFAHERHIVHRDIKGANILVDRDGRVMVSDFGIARAAEEKTLTASGSVIGTPHFMSPEQCAGQKVGPQSDQYSLGVLAFQMLTGQVPFDAESVITIIQHHYFTPVPDIQAVREGVPEQLLALVYQAMAKDAGKRFSSTREMVKALEAVPFPPEEKAQSEETLRSLARGEPVPKIRTASLPPLADARTIGVSALGPLSATIAGTGTATRPSARRPRPRQRSRAPLVAAVSVAVIALGAAGAWLALRGNGVANRPPADRPAQQPAAAAPATDTTRAVTPPPAQTVAPATATHPPSRRAAVTAAPAGAIAAQAPPAEPAGSGLLRVRTVPPSALILVDGRRVGEPGSAFDVEIAAGRRRIRITAPGYLTFDTTVIVEVGLTRNLGQIVLRSEGGP